jgi:hypothetical protein
MFWLFNTDIFHSVQYKDSCELFLNFLLYFQAT